MVERGGHLTGVGDVGRHGDSGRSGGTAFGRCRFEIVAGEGDDRDGGALLCQPQCGGATDSRAGPSDEGDAVGEAGHCHSLLVDRLQIAPQVIHRIRVKVLQ